MSVRCFIVKIDQTNALTFWRNCGCRWVVEERLKRTIFLRKFSYLALVVYHTSMNRFWNAIVSPKKPPPLWFPLVLMRAFSTVSPTGPPTRARRILPRPVLSFVVGHNKVQTSQPKVKSLFILFRGPIKMIGKQKSKIKIAVYYWLLHLSSTCRLRSSNSTNSTFIFKSCNTI